MKLKTALILVGILGFYAIRHTQAQKQEKAEDYLGSLARGEAVLIVRGRLVSIEKDAPYRGGVHAHITHTAVLEIREVIYGPPSLIKVKLAAGGRSSEEPEYKVDDSGIWFLDRYSREQRQFVVRNLPEAPALDIDFGDDFFQTLELWPADDEFFERNGMKFLKLTAEKKEARDLQLYRLVKKRLESDRKKLAEAQSRTDENLKLIESKIKKSKDKDK